MRRRTRWDTSFADHFTSVEALFGVDTYAWASILREYTTAERLRVALPMVAGLRCTHAELAALVCASREKVTLALKQLRAEGFTPLPERRRA